MKKLRPWRFLLWFAFPLVAVLAWKSASNISIGQTLASFKINTVHLLALIGFNAAAVFLFNSRWWLILRALGYRIPYLAALRYRMAAFAISYFTPGAQFGGEPVQVYALHVRHGVRGADALASVTLDKLFELLSNFTFLALGLTLILDYPQKFGMIGSKLALWSGGPALLPLVYLVLVWARRSPLRALAGWVEPRLSAKMKSRPMVQMALGAACGSEEQIAELIRRNPGLILQIMASSAVIWALSLAEYWLALHVLGVSLTPAQTVLALTAARLAFLTPLPGGLGALEAGQMLAMSLLGLSPLTGVAISLWIRVRDITLGAVGAACGTALMEPESVQPLSSTAGD